MPAVRAPDDLVSFDIWQACTPHINGGQCYVIVFTDHFSRFRRGYLLSKKKNSAEALDRFVNFATSVRVRVKRLHRDGAGELLDTDKLTKPVLVKHNICRCVVCPPRCFPWVARFFLVNLLYSMA